MSMKDDRGLTRDFMGDLQDGILAELLQLVKIDTTLDLQIRNNAINVYYRGGSILRAKAAAKVAHTYFFQFNRKYFGKMACDIPSLPDPTVNSKELTMEWVAIVPFLKHTMDLWFGAHPKDERAMQQLVVWENNDSSYANGTDYFIVDIEYDSRKGNSEAGAGGRFDLVALYWASDSGARQMKGSLKPRLVVVEMKAGDSALKGVAGLQKHMADFHALSEPSRASAFIDEMLGVFAQKRAIGLIRDLRGNGHRVTADVLEPEIGFMFLLAGHDPASSLLSTELTDLGDDSPAKVCVANFMGYGLYEECIYSIADLRARFRKQIPIGCCDSTDPQTP